MNDFSTNRIQLNDTGKAAKTIMHIPGVAILLLYPVFLYSLAFAAIERVMEASRCTNRIFKNTTILCRDPPGGVIEIRRSTFYAYPDSSSNRTDCDYRQGDSVIEVRDADRDFYVEMLAQCDGRTSCDNVRAVDRRMRIPNRIVISDYMVIQYSCLKNPVYKVASACTHSVLSRNIGPKCDPGSVIFVVDAYYGVQMKDCRRRNAGIDMICTSAVENDVLTDIRNKCNDRVHCKHLEIPEKPEDMYYDYHEDVCGGWDRSELIQIKYRCIWLSGAPPTSATNTTTEETTGTYSSTVKMDKGTEAKDIGIPLGVAGAIVLSVLLVVVVVALIGRRQKQKQNAYS